MGLRHPPSFRRPLSTDVAGFQQEAGSFVAEGTIKRKTDRGFGFINTGTGKDLFFHMSVVQGVSFDDLQEGQRVTYTEGRGPKGPCAESVRPV
jgi:cold shock protein